jgi:hypothetical protein
MNRCRVARVAGFVVAFASVATLSPSLAASATMRRPLALHRATHGPATQLYEARGTSIVAYPLNSDGLPATTPDWQLAGGLSGARWFGIDGAGYIYVADSGRDRVRVYAPGASGDALPVAAIPIPGSTCSIAVNRAGYIFVTTALAGDYCYPSIAVYAPVVVGMPNAWLPEPIHTITPDTNAALEELVVDGSGRLYAAAGAHIFVYDDPIDAWQSPSRVLHNQPTEDAIMSPIAVEPETLNLYFSTFVSSVAGAPWGDADFGMRSLANTVPDVLTETRRCYSQSFGFGQEYSLAVDRRYLMFTCASPQQLMVYHNRSGRQDLVETLPAGTGLLLWP